MEIKELKPNFERIIHILNIPESHLKKSHPSKIWESITNGVTYYDINHVNDLKSLLEEFNIEAFYSDITFFALSHVRREKELSGIKEWHNLVKGKDEDLLYTLKFLYDNDIQNVKIDLKNKKYNQSTSINNHELIQVIKKALLDYFIETDYYFEQGFSRPEEIKDWGEYINFIILEKECYSAKKGRKSKYPLAGRLIDSLQKYLQEYTEIKAEEGTTISRRQASFIYNLLNIFDLIHDKLAFEEDNIRHILTKYREKQSKKKATNVEKAMNEYSEYSESMKAKIKKINKNK